MEHHVTCYLLHVTCYLLHVTCYLRIAAAQCRGYWVSFLVITIHHIVRFKVVVYTWSHVHRPKPGSAYVDVTPVIVAGVPWLSVRIC